MASFWKRGRFERENGLFKLPRFPAAVWEMSELDKTTEIEPKPEISCDNGDKIRFFLVVILNFFLYVS